jgi:hypothetical protein
VPNLDGQGMDCAPDGASGFHLAWFTPTLLTAFLGANKFVLYLVLLFSTGSIVDTEYDLVATRKWPNIITPCARPELLPIVHIDRDLILSDCTDPKMDEMWLQYQVCILRTFSYSVSRHHKVHTEVCPWDTAADVE